MADLNLDELEKLARAATPGPWHAPGMGELHAENHDEIAQILFHTGDDEDMQCGTEDDAKFIAAANPAVVLALIEAARSAVPAQASAAEVDDAEALAACPLCSGKPYTNCWTVGPGLAHALYQWWHASCSSCAYSVAACCSENEAVALWNQFAANPTSKGHRLVSAAVLARSAVPAWTTLTEGGMPIQWDRPMTGLYADGQLRIIESREPDGSIERCRTATPEETRWIMLMEATHAVPAQASAAEDDAGALDMARVINKKLTDMLLGRTYLLPDDLAALKRFHECATDFDSGGHDVPKAAMARLREIGVVQSLGFGRHQATSFGDYVLERIAGEPVKLPLMTMNDWRGDDGLPITAAAPVPAQGEQCAVMTAAARDVLAERQHQASIKNWKPEHGQHLWPEQIASDMSYYASTGTFPETMKPWPAEWAWPRDFRANYVSAAALLLARIEAIDAAAQGQQEPGR